jgi:transposase-like protein
MWNHLLQGLSVSIYTVDLPVEACPSCLRSHVADTGVYPCGRHRYTSNNDKNR